MRNLVKYVGIGLLVMGLAACDDKDTNATAQGSVKCPSLKVEPIEPSFITFSTIPTRSFDSVQYCLLSA